MPTGRVDMPQNAKCISSRLLCARSCKSGEQEWVQMLEAMYVPRGKGRPSTLACHQTLHSFQGPAKRTNSARPIVSQTNREQESVLNASHLDVHGSINLRGDVARLVPAIDGHQVFPGPALRRRAPWLLTSRVTALP